MLQRQKNVDEELFRYRVQKRMYLMLHHQKQILFVDKDDLKNKSLKSKAVLALFLMLHMIPGDPVSIVD